jgi:hypothetical protein
LVIHPAANICRSKWPSWYLPANDELSTIYDNRNVLLNLTSNDYWSSTSHASVLWIAWTRNLVNLSVSNAWYDSTNNKRVRCTSSF